MQVFASGDPNNAIELFTDLTQNNVEDVVNSGSGFIDVEVIDFDTPPAPFVFPTTTLTARYTLAGGDSGLTGISDADYIGTTDPVTGERTGLKLLENRDEVNS
jgi:hypothetical protein